MGRTRGRLMHWAGWLILLVTVVGCAGAPTQTTSTPPVPATPRPTARPTPTPTTTPQPTATPDPTEEPDETLSPASAELLDLLPEAWHDSCFSGSMPIDGAVGYLTCMRPAKDVRFVTLVDYVDPLDAAGEYGDYFWPDTGDICAEYREDGDLLVGGSLIGTAGGCTDADWFAFVLDTEGVAGYMTADDFDAARDAFEQARPFPARYTGAITGEAFDDGGAKTFADLKADSDRPSYSSLVHDNAELEGERVYYRGEVQQYTLDPDAPFSVLLWVRRESGVYTGGPVGLTGYDSDPVEPGDIIEVIGEVGSMVTYDSVGGSRTIPTIDVERTRLVE